MSMNFISHFGTDLENMIRLKVSLGGAESTYLDRAQNFDRFCLEKYPDADCLTEPLALSWMVPAPDAPHCFPEGSHAVSAAPCRRPGCSR